MINLMKLTLPLKVTGLGLFILFSSTAALAVDVTCSGGNCVSSNSGGLWNNFGYGDCFYMLPTATVRETELPIGPGATQTASSFQACIGGALTNSPDISVRISRGNPEEEAYSWSYGSTYPFNPGAAQFIPSDCMINRGDLDSENPDRRNGTFDNGDVNPSRPVLEPLSAEFTLSGSVTGDATLSYYFMNGSNECRKLNWSLKVDNNTGSGLSEVQSGTIGDFENGKYLEFNLAGLSGNETFRLDMTDPVGDAPTCADAPDVDINSVISGIFISGTSVCAPPPYCGDGIVGPGETCEEPGDAVNPEPVTGPQTCSDNCTYCGDGFTDPDEACDPTDPSVEEGTCTNTCEPVEVPSLGCRFTGGLNDVFITGNGKENSYTAGGQVGANTGQQPQPKGEWTHTQHSGPAGEFTFHGGTASAPLGSEIDAIRCSDPGGCKPSGDPPSPVKQLDFDGIGTFKNIGKKDDEIPDFVKDGANVTAEGNGNKDFDGTLHWFEVNIDDLGEPGNTNPRKNPGDADPELCPSIGFGEKGAKEPGSCSCSDFYRITIYNGVDAATVPRNPDGSIDKAKMKTAPEDVIYEVWGYIDGGNLQLHHPTGFDKKLLAE